MLFSDDFTACRDDLFAGSFSAHYSDIVKVQDIELQANEYGDGSWLKSGEQRVLKKNIHYEKAANTIQRAVRSRFIKKDGPFVSVRPPSK